ncbi:UNKNOWN [Stylonychia lemnae]|uniref:Uncharacterized protein n=1 Tax=Stylonychia lemnae TaxID=5949 RepID=A0A078AE19_STYLE|nr:UNKNOWN [Stylonychia lemnae]|eukprot:CDW80484.1 UNKNOWN [Stylonychia lemnae]
MPMVQLKFSEKFILIPPFINYSRVSFAGSTQSGLIAKELGPILQMQTQQSTPNIEAYLNAFNLLGKERGRRNKATNQARKYCNRGQFLHVRSKNCIRDLLVFALLCQDTRFNNIQASLIIDYTSSNNEQSSKYQTVCIYYVRNRQYSYSKLSCNERKNRTYF